MRKALTISIAVAITLVLFYGMRVLISDSAVPVEPPSSPPIVDVIEAPDEERTPPSEDPPPDIEKPQTGIETETVVVTVEPPEGPMPPVRPPPSGGDGEWSVRSVSVEAGDPIPKIVLPPQYPRERMLDGTEGWVRIAFTIEADGSVSGASVVDAAPRRGVFDHAALSAIRHWRFEPKRDNDGEPVRSRAQYTIEFKLNDGA